MTLKTNSVTKSWAALLISVFLFCFQILLSEQFKQFIPDSPYFYYQVYALLGYIPLLVVAGLIVDFYKSDYVALGAFAGALFGYYLIIHAVPLGAFLLKISAAFLFISAMKTGAVCCSKKYFTLFVGVILGFQSLTPIVSYLYSICPTENLQELQTITLTVGILLLFLSAGVLFRKQNELEVASPTFLENLQSVLNFKPWVAALLIFIASLCTTICWSLLSYNTIQHRSITVWFAIIYVIGIAFWSVKVIAWSCINAYSKPSTKGFVFGMMAAVISFIEMSFVVVTTKLSLMVENYNDNEYSIFVILAVILSLAAVLFFVIKPQNDDANPKLTQFMGSEKIIKNKVRPWVRYFARSVDYFIWGNILYAVVMVLPISNLVIHSVNMDALLGIFKLVAFFVIVFSWIIIEGFFLSTFSTTPGKWLLNIKVLSSTDETLTVGSSLQRSFRVWCRGLAMGLPLFSLITTVYALAYLFENKITSWDKDGDIQVIHGKLSYLKLCLLFLMIAGVWYFLM